MFFRGNDIGNEIKKAETRNDKSSGFGLLLSLILFD